jgi:hypothetical protein
LTLIMGSNSVSSISLRCDHCRDELGFRVHRYWLMRFLFCKLRRRVPGTVVACCAGHIA